MQQVKFLLLTTLFFILSMLGQVKGYDPKVTGLLMLPYSGIGILTTPLAVPMIGKNNYRHTIIIGSIVLVIGTLLFLFLDPSTPIFIILLIAAVIDIPNGLNNIGLSTSLYSNTKPEETGVASGIFQTFRSIGSILSTSLQGLTFGSSITTGCLHMIAILTVVISSMLLIVSLSRKFT
jgi:predicted MFS family arabinose efflux permease